MTGGARGPEPGDERADPREWVRIRDRNEDGRGRGRLGERTALVVQAHPGELVRVRPDRLTRGTVQGRVEELRDPAADRLASPCPHEFVCTGCALLAASEDEELRFKEAALLAALGSDAAKARVHPIQSRERFGYRHYAKLIASEGRDGLLLGSYVQGTHHVADNAGCPVLAPRLAETIERIAGALRAEGVRAHAEGTPGLRHLLARLGRVDGRVHLALVMGEEDGAPPLERAARALLADPRAAVAGVAMRVDGSEGNSLLEGREIAHLGETFVTEEILGVRHRVDALRFFQINPPTAELLFGAALELAGEGERVVETHAGSGALTVLLARRFALVEAIEIVPAACERLRESAAGLPIVVHPGDVQRLLPDLLARPADLLVCDPPRRGLEPETLAALDGSAPPAILLLSCSLKALAKDRQALKSRGYELAEVIPVDQFPRTSHLEIVSLFRRSSRTDS